MADAIDGTASTEDIAGKLQQATDEFEEIMAANQMLHQEFEANEWSGLDDLTQARAELDRARDALAEVARKVGLAGQVSEAYAQNEMVGNKESLGRN